MANDLMTTRQIVEALEVRGETVGTLSPVGVRPPLGEYIRRLWERRHFIWMDAGHRVTNQNNRNRLGNVWLVLKPFLDAFMYWVIFALILGIDRGMANYTAYLVIGILMFRSTMSSISSGPGILGSGRAMIRAFSFPRASLVVSAEVRSMFQMFYSIPVMLVAIIVLPNHETPEWTWLILPAVFVMHQILNLGIAFFMARIGHIVPDASQVMSFSARFLMYGSGVIFPVDRFLDNQIVSVLIQLNPIYHMLALYRGILMDGVIPPLGHWLYLAGWGIGLTVLGFVFFWRGEATYGGDE